LFKLFYSMTDCNLSLSLGVILNLLVEGETILFLLDKLKVDFFLDLLLLLLLEQDDVSLFDYLKL
jgi:hypothetical protein